MASPRVRNGVLRRRQGMSKTDRAERAERVEDERGNRVPYPGWDPGAGDDWEAADFVAGVYLPELPPHRDAERNELVRRALQEVLYARGHEALLVMVDARVAAPVYDVAAEVFDVLVALNDYDPEDMFATPERDALFASLSPEVLGDELLAEFAGDAHFCMGMGEPIEESAAFLLGAREGEGEWDEFRVSFRVAMQET